MRWRLIAWISFALNIALLAALIAARGRGSKDQPVGGTTLAQTSSTNTQLRSIPIPVRQFLRWGDIESSDYRTYIANLRDMGCPEQTVRDIIIADVNALFSRRLATELVTADQQWWRSEPDAEIQEAAEAKAEQIEGERRELLASLLGPNWETGDMVNLQRPSRPGVVLDGAVLGILPPETKQAVQETALRSEERLEAYLQKMRAEGKEPDEAELAKLQRQTREDLARILTPPQLEEYLLRYSETANELRLTFGELAYFDASPDEFRAVFRAIDNIQQQISALGSGTDPNTAQARKTLETQRENAIRTALGKQRYDEYRMLQDPVYRDAVAQARDAGTPEAARTIYTINMAAAAEQNRILSSTNLTAEQKNVELKQLELDQLKANTLATGNELPPEPEPTPVPPAPRTYTIRRGDNAAVVSMIYGVPLSAISAANPGVNLNQLKPGDVITIPRSTVPPPLPP